MAKPRPRKLKVFRAQFGFFDSVVAAPSQAAALRAWGTHQDLFASGEARLTDDPAAVEAALAHPEAPLQRAVGTKDPFQLDAPASSKVPGLGTSGSRKGAMARKKPDRSKLDRAEKALQDLDRDWEEDESQFRREQEELESRHAAAREEHEVSRKEAKAVIAAARSAYRAAGGR